MIDFKGIRRLSVSIRTEGKPVGMLVAPELDKLTHTTPFEETFFDDVLVIKGLTQSLSPKMAQAVRLFVLGHESYHLKFNENQFERNLNARSRRRAISTA